MGRGDGTEDTQTVFDSQLRFAHDEADQKKSVVASGQLQILKDVFGPQDDPELVEAVQAIVDELEDAASAADRFEGKSVGWVIRELEQRLAERSRECQAVTKELEQAKQQLAIQREISG